MNPDNILKMKETDTGGHKCCELFKTGKYVELENRSERLFRAGCVGVRLEYHRDLLQGGRAVLKLTVVMVTQLCEYINYPF